ncbi:hypothetical protein [Lelliottia nimipressuralis]|uniref:hypothetical protein n=1 Tax=Lelliottia nimipressuralis TaxID=69220 RepID=UPI0028A292C2|nr:hypothetical protein [Lelliottia nimipressuralis]
MMKNASIHLLGASGSGTTSVGHQLESLLGIRHLDTDSFYWLDTAEPFSHPRPESERKNLLSEALSESGSWVLSGSLCGWGDFLIPRFNLVIWIWVNHSLRMERLRIREERMYEQAMYADDNIYTKRQKFLSWAESYDTSFEVSRNAKKHAEWLKRMSCPVFIVSNNGAIKDTTDNIKMIIESGMVQKSAYSND